MDLNKPLRMTQGDMSGTPIAFVEGRRVLGRVTLLDSPHISSHSTSEPLCDLVWGEIAVRQTGYRRATERQGGQIVLYDPLSEDEMAALGGPLPQDPSGHSNEAQALDQRQAREALRGS